MIQEKRKNRAHTQSISGGVPGANQQQTTGQAAPEAMGDGITGAKGYGHSKSQSLHIRGVQ